jgi:hypothetical protein
VGQKRSEAADALENLDNKPDVPEDCGSIEVLFLPHQDTGSRAKRASEAADMLNSAAQALHDYCDGKEHEDGTESGEEFDRSEFDELADQLENDASELESIEFPGMYG